MSCYSYSAPAYTAGHAIKSSVEELFPMTQLLLPIIYLAFISLGLPDSLLGSAWPTMYPQLGVPFSYAGILSMIISLGTIVSLSLIHISEPTRH